jgi:hypothetical protein
VIANAAGAARHMQTYGELAADTELPARRDRVLHDEGLGRRGRAAGVERARHDACHALRAQGIHAQPRALLGAIPDMQLVEIADGDRCCGAAGLYNVTEPELAGRLRLEKAEAVRATGARVIASANPGCTMQLRAGLAALTDARVVHPVELLDVRSRPAPKASPALDAPQSLVIQLADPCEISPVSPLLDQLLHTSLSMGSAHPFRRRSRPPNRRIRGSRPACRRVPRREANQCSKVASRRSWPSRRA